MDDVIDMMDTIRTSVHNIPQSCQKVAGYVTGSGDIPWTDAEWALFPHAGHVTINQAPGSSQPFIGNVKDIETGAGSIADFVAEARIREQQRHWNYAGYVDAADAAACAAACRSAGLSMVELWIADWRLNRQQAIAQLGTMVNGYPVVGIQWASPTSNPDTIVPGSTLTLKEANIDLSVTVASWFPPPAAPTPPPPPPVTILSGQVSGTVLGVAFTALIKSTDGGKTWGI